MVHDSPAFNGVTVDHIPAAKAFYVDILGLDVTEENGMLTLHLAGAGPRLFSRGPTSVPAPYTVLNFPVGDIAWFTGPAGNIMAVLQQSSTP